MDVKFKDQVTLIQNEEKMVGIIIESLRHKGDKKNDHPIGAKIEFSTKSNVF